MEEIMTRKEQIEWEAQSYWDCNPKYAFKEAVEWNIASTIGMTLQEKLHLIILNMQKNKEE